MTAKTTIVVLVSVAGEQGKFEFTHAENILRLPNSQWRIADPTKYEFVNNALQRIRTPQGAKGK